MRKGVVTAVEVADLVTDLRALACRFDPDAFALAQVEPVIADLGRAERIVTGTVTLMARRAGDITADGQAADDRTGTTAADGAAALLARATGTTPAQAKRDLATSARLKGQAGVADAVRKGELSGVQAEAVADAVAADPTAEWVARAARSAGARTRRP